MKLLIVDDEKLFRWSLNKTLSKAGYEVMEAASAQEAKQSIASEEPDIVFLDINLPDGNGVNILKWARSSFPEIMFLMITAKGRVIDAVDAIKSGAYDYLEKPIDMESILHHANRAKELIELKRKLSRFSQNEENQTVSVVAESPLMIETLRLARTFAESGALTALLLGESGSGKDVLARYIHNHSTRRNQAMMAINCAAVPENLLESELFGFEKGAFTDAKNMKRGILELAHEGTVFLDEIAEMNPAMQAKLLRVLEDWTFKRIGGTRDIHVDVRLIAATNQNLEALVKERKFREDLFYRLNVFPIYIPALRERPDDIQALANHFIHIYNRKFGKNILGFSKEAIQNMLVYSWPGNVRELRNVIERAMILQSGSYIEPPHLHLRREETSPHSFFNSIIPLGQAEKMLIEKALGLTQGNVVRAARLLRISRDKLRYKIKKHEIHPSH